MWYEKWLHKSHIKLLKVVIIDNKAVHLSESLSSFHVGKLDEPVENESFNQTTKNQQLTFQIVSNIS